MTSREYWQGHCSPCDSGVRLMMSPVCPCKVDEQQGIPARLADHRDTHFRVAGEFSSSAYRTTKAHLGRGICRIIPYIWLARPRTAVLLSKAIRHAGPPARQIHSFLAISTRAATIISGQKWVAANCMTRCISSKCINQFCPDHALGFIK